MKFNVTDNMGVVHLVEHEWTKEDGMPSEYEILEQMEVCSCQLNESNNHCDGDCINFDEGKVEIIN